MPGTRLNSARWLPTLTNLDSVKRGLAANYLGLTLTEVFVGKGEGVDRALDGDCIIVSNHEASSDAGIALAISLRAGGTFKHLAAEHVLIKQPWLSRLGLFSLPERSDVFTRLNAIDDAVSSWPENCTIHLWVMPSEGHWPIQRSGISSSVGTAMADALSSRSPSILGAVLSYVTFSFRRPVALVWLERISSEAETAGSLVQQRLQDAKVRGEIQFAGNAPLETLIGRKSIALVRGLPVLVAPIAEKIRLVRFSSEVMVESGRLHLDPPLVAEEVSRAEIEMNGIAGPNLAREIAQVLSERRGD